MRKIWLTSSSICLAMGDAVAMNLMFEDKQDHKLFFKYWNKYLGGMAKLINYHLTPTGWTLLFKTKSSQEIKSAYHELRNQSHKAKAQNTLDDVSRILSEHFRIFLSQFVRSSNILHQRKGTKVMQRFHKYVLNESSDFEELFERITRQQRRVTQSDKKYQADESEYDVDKKMEGDSIWKIGTRMYNGGEGWFRRRYGVFLIKPNSSVLRKFLKPRIFNTLIPPDS